MSIVWCGVGESANGCLSAITIDHPPDDLRCNGVWCRVMRQKRDAQEQSKHGHTLRQAPSGMMMPSNSNVRNGSKADSSRARIHTADEGADERVELLGTLEVAEMADAFDRLEA